MVFLKKNEVLIKSINNNLCPQNQLQLVVEVENLWNNKFRKEILKPIFTKHNNKEKQNLSIVVGLRLQDTTSEVVALVTPVRITNTRAR